MDFFEILHDLPKIFDYRAANRAKNEILRISSVSPFMPPKPDLTLRGCDPLINPKYDFFPNFP
jgi:hypothetical protein